MASTGEILFGGVFLLVGLGVAVAGVMRLRSWVTMRRMDPTDAVAIEEGLQEFEGRARPVGETITAPFTGTESLICNYKVERYDYDDDGSNWHTITTDEREVPFEVEQGGRSVAVVPDDAQDLLTSEFRVDTRDTDQLPDRVDEFMNDNVTGWDASIDIGPIEIGGNRRYRFTEKRLDAGEEVYVLGPVRRDPSAVPAADTRFAVAPQDRSWSDRLFGKPFVVADTGEEQAERRQLKSGVLLVLFGLIFAGVPVLIAVLG